MKRTQSTAADAVGAIVGHVIGWAFAIWLAMILIGAAHSTDQRIPSLGFSTVAVAFLGAAVSALGVATGARSNKAKS